MFSFNRLLESTDDSSTGAIEVSEWDECECICVKASRYMPYEVEGSLLRNLSSLIHFAVDYAK